MAVFWGVPGKTAYYYTGGTAGTATTLLLPGGYNDNAAAAMAIDTNGDVVGYATPADGAGQVDAFFYRNSTSTIYDLPKPTGAGYDGYSYIVFANAISPNGAYVVGPADY